MSFDHRSAGVKLARVCACAALCAIAGCRSEPSAAELTEWTKKADSLARVVASQHRGPAVANGNSGTARFARLVWDTFQTARAMETVTFVDRFYREPANEGYERALDHVADALRAAGFGTHPGLELQVLETPMDVPSWTPRRARITLLETPGRSTVLHAFEAEDDQDRTILPRNAPSADVEGEIVWRLDDVHAGQLLVTSDAPSHTLLARAKEQGAVAVLSSALEAYNVDPSGKQRHLDAVQYDSVSYPSPLPVARISARTHNALRAAREVHPNVRVHFEAQVEFVERPLRTLVATIAGSAHPELAIALVAHVQEPGACDNASGVGTVLELARSFAELVASGRIIAPARSLVFVFGNEIEQSRIWLAATDKKCVAAFSADMTGESTEATGAIALLERMPDPAALTILPPDAHTPWGRARVTPEDVRPNGLAVIAREALVDAGALAGNWITSEHPFEGGSDHDVFIHAGIPAVLFWHFTDFAYHTSLDRLAHVDANEMQRTGTALMAAALAIADPSPLDLDRHLWTLKLEIDLRLAACEQAQLPELAEQWRAWSKGARLWLIDQCLESNGKNALTPAVE